MKTCSICKQSKGPAAFGRRTKSPDGLRYTCKACDLEAVRRARAHDPERMRAHGRKQYWKNPERGREYALAKRNADKAKACAAVREWRQKNPEKMKAQQKRYRESQPLRNHATQVARYGLTVESYAALLSSQGGGCAICKATTSPCGRRFAIDHCHRTHRVRGLLCNNCNALIGFANDSIATLEAAIEYLGRYLAETG